MAMANPRGSGADRTAPAILGDYGLSIEGSTVLPYTIAHLGREERTMAWSPIREATEEDMAKLNERARAFMERHDMTSLGILSPLNEVEARIDEMIQGYGHDVFEQRRGKYLDRLWRAVVRRALKEPQADGIGYGYVGYTVD
jgi:hypothetical protein